MPFGPGFVSFDVNGVISGFGSAVIGLALHQAAYAAEIIRAGIISVDPGPVEAAKSLGLPWRRQFFTIVAPQAMRGIGFAKGSQRELPPTPLQRLRGKITEIIGKRR